MTTETITEQGHRHGSDYADYTWQIDPAEYDMAYDWCAAAEDGTLSTIYDIPEDAAAAIPADLDTAGWTWADLADYQAAWRAGYFERTTELCRNLIEQVNA